MFMNVNILDKIIKNDKKRELDWNWNNANDKKFVDLIKLKSSKEIFLYFDKVFQTDAKHEIIKSFISK